MAGEIQKHLWADLANAPAAPGIYAWYYSPQITDFDLDRAIENIESIRGTDRGEAERAARTLLDDRIFRQFREEPYQAVVEGPLKPAYRGALDHAFEISSGLVSRVVDHPERLRSLRNILNRSAPMFASPLYIGMSVDLRSRLATHKSLIERYRVARLKERPSARNSDAGFAWQIAKRQISPDRLMVFTCVTGDDDESTAVDIENVLNRLYYPILGRN
ncbi:hypothetical protein [Sphingomonas oryzagri]|uniref:Uncharacterized protein n=1 Tax=Sphingomonas oryzagri TaxID=3042314 RepID=A0ABT6N568_9SPHN|nr:hypothetical protein [Sphingomonas oryzagri]MDH7640248.1 hypothetical protein [Sphingomonas oryzagri]